MLQIYHAPIYHLYATLALVMFLVSCGETEPTPTPMPTVGNSYTTNGIKLDVVEIRKARSAAQAGWQDVEIQIVVENVTQSLIHGAPAFCGTLIDTGGYEREAYGEWRLSDSGNSRYGSPILVPGMRIKDLVVRTRIPQDQQVKSLVVNQQTQEPLINCNNQYGSEWQFDLTSPLSTIRLPYESMPPIAPVHDDGRLEYEQSEAYKLSLNNIRFSEADNGAPLLVAEYRIENTGGYDLCFNLERVESQRCKFGPTLIGADTEGRYFEYVLETRFDLPGRSTEYQIAPSVGRVVDISLGYFSQYEELGPDYIYLVLLDSFQGKPVAQTTVPFVMEK